MVFADAGDWAAWRLKFEAGEVDQYICRSDEVSSFEERAVRDSTVKLFDLGPRSGTNHFWLNQNPGKDARGVPFVDPVKLAWFRDLRFRQAIAHAIDREAIVATCFAGRGSVIDGPVSPSERFWCNDRLTHYHHDPEKAKALLAEAKADGVPVDTTLHLIGRSNLFPGVTEVTEALQQMLQDLFTRYGGSEGDAFRLAVAGFNGINLLSGVSTDNLTVVLNEKSGANQSSVTISSKDTTNVRAFRPKTHESPTSATSTNVNACVRHTCIRTVPTCTCRPGVLRRRSRPCPAAASAGRRDP
jgi:ABC-type oligopeptide transport system substrate-binding subunit